MGKSCVVYGCLSKATDPDVSFHVLPRSAVLRVTWIANIPHTRRRLEFSSIAYVCSRHFEKSHFQYTRTGTRILKDGAVPTIFQSQKLAVGEKNSLKRTLETQEHKNSVLNPVSNLPKEQNISSHQSPVKLLLEDHMISSHEDVNGTMSEQSFTIYAGTSQPKEKPAFEAVHHINVKALLQHFHENIGDCTVASKDHPRKNVLFIRGGKELFAAVVQKSKNSSPGGTPVIKDKDGGIWKTNHILRINCRPGKMVIKNADIIAKIEDPNGVFSSAAEKTISMIDDLTCSTTPPHTENSEKCAAIINQTEDEVTTPPHTDNSEKCVAMINQTEDEVHVRTLAEKGQISEKMDIDSSSEQACHTGPFTEEEQMLGKKDVSSSEQITSSSTKTGNTVIENAGLIATFKHVDYVSSTAEEEVSPEDIITSSAVPSLTGNSGKCVPASLSQKDEETHHARTIAEEEEMLRMKDVSRSEHANSSPAKIWELRFECDLCKRNNEIVFLKPSKFTSEFTVFLCPIRKCPYPFGENDLHRFIFKNLPDEMLLACSPDDAPTVRDIASTVRQSTKELQVLLRQYRKVWH